MNEFNLSKSLELGFNDLQIYNKEFSGVFYQYVTKNIIINKLKSLGFTVSDISVKHYDNITKYNGLFTS